MQLDLYITALRGDRREEMEWERSEKPSRRRSNKLWEKTLYRLVIAGDKREEKELRGMRIED